MAQLDNDIGLVLAEAQGHGRGRQHDRRVHDRQRHRTLHLARWRNDAVRAVQRDDLRRRLPRAVHRPLARPHPGGHGAERPHVRPGLVPHLPCRRRQPEHHRPVAQGREARRPDLQEPSRRLRPDWPCSPAKARPIVTRSSTSAKAPSARCASTITSSPSSTNPRAGSAKKPTWTCPTSPTCASIRSSAWAGPTTGRKKGASLLRMVQV